jgi:hypothetical protein
LLSTVALTPVPGVADAAAGTMSAVAPHSNIDSVFCMTVLLSLVLDITRAACSGQHCGFPRGTCR